MAEVLFAQRQHDSPAYSFGSPLKRSSPSYSSFLVGSPNSRSTRASPPTSGSHKFNSSEHRERLSHSLPSSTATSFTDLSQPPSFSSTPASSISFASTQDEYEEIAFPAYDEVQFFHTDEPLDLPPSPPGEASAVELEEGERRDEATSSTTGSTRSDSPLATPTVADDTAVKREPSRHVDYLSHDWREEDIWSSWRHIVSQRKVYGQRSRLENASWRTWAKSKYHLATVSPETLNWLKESDVTWLYGPLQSAATHPLTNGSAKSPSRTPNTISIKAKKPILKKRSMSEVMLQRSLSTSSLLKQAAASVQAQQSDLRVRRHSYNRGTSGIPELLTPNTLAHPVSREHEQLDYFSSRTSSSGQETPCDCHPKRHIRFDDKVEQCIAVECKDGDEDEGSDDEEESRHENDSDSDSSDEGVVMMRRPPRRKQKTTRPKSLSRSSSSSASGRTIEKLPATTLKYRVEVPEVVHPPTPFARSWSSSKLSPSPSSETLRPSHPSRNYLLVGDDDDDVDAEMSWQPSSNRRDSVAVTKARTGLLTSLGHDDDEDAQESGMRRTNSGMFMPYEEDEDDIMAQQLGLLGKVSDTINTAKDIAHVIWNVGWRK